MPLSTMDSMMTDFKEPQTDFGFEKVPLSEKAKRVADVFRSVAPKYDMMNDLMSFGLHRIWKRIAVTLANIHEGDRVLDLAGGTGDLTALMAKQVGATGRVVLSDINEAMLNHGRDKLIDRGIFANVEFVQADAEKLPFPDNHFDVVTIAFGLRNVTQQAKALAEMLRVLKPGGQLLVLEFSEFQIAALKPAYDFYSFKILPKLGELVANDADSYRYLAESIRKHPNQQKLLAMMETAGFKNAKVHNLMGGIVALHRGYKL